MELWQLKQLQTVSLEAKIMRTERKIREWYHHWDGEVYVSFSGGKDSTVLLNIVRSLYPKVPAVYVDTGLEYPEIRDFVKTFDNILWYKPKKTFKQVLEEYGYPVISKRVARYIRDLQNQTDKNQNTVRLRLTGINQKGDFCPSMKIPNKWVKLKDAPFKISERCCDIMKKEPFHRYVKETGKKPMTGVMASESSMREKQWMKQGCNAFDLNEPISMPLSFWTEQDILQYIKDNDIPYASVYGNLTEEDGKLRFDGEQRTGCMFCMFGAHLEKGENRFQRMSRTHPKQYQFCMDKLGLKQVLEYLNIPYQPISDTFKDW